MLLILFFSSAVLVAAAFLAAWTLRERSAAERHAVWLCVLGALVLLPLTPRLPKSSMALPEAATIAPGPLRTVVEVTGYASPRPSIGNWMWWIWAAGAALTAMRFARARALARHIVRDAEPFEPGVRISGQARVPFVCSLRDPVILLPAEARAWPREQIESALAHERMHLQRRDLWWQALGHVACTLYWPQPLVWLAARKMREECERACDDGVLAGGVGAVDYAEHLVSIGRAAVSGPRVALAGGITMTHGRNSDLTGRVDAILNYKMSPGVAGRWFTCMAAVAAAALTLALAQAQPPAHGAASGGRAFTGVVMDPSNAMIPGARIDIRGVNDFYEVIYSGAAGDFSLPGLPDGDYDITVAKPGFARMTLNGMHYEAAQAKPFELKLNVGQIQERVRVEAQAPASSANPPAANGAPPSRIRIGGNVQSTKLEYKAPVLYPPTAKADRVQGTVLLRAVISREGNVINLEQMNHMVDKRLVEAAMDGVKQWRYTPTLLNGQPVEVLTVVEVNFTLLP